MAKLLRFVAGVEVGMDFTKQQLIGLTGGAVLLLGIFLPIVSMPIVGSVSIFSSGRIDGYVLLGLAIIGLILSFTNNLKPLRLVGGVSLLIVVIDFIYLLYKLKSIKGDVSEKLQGNPFGGMAEAMMSTVQIQYGWVFLFIGGALLIYAAFAVDSTNQSERVYESPDIAIDIPKSTKTKLVATDMFAHNAGVKAKSEEKVDDVEFKACPFCAEQIRVSAIKCKHCGSMLESN